MLKPGTILNRLYEQLESSAQNRQIADLRVGLSYVGIQLDNGMAGLAAVLPETMPRSCTVLNKAGTYIGASAAKTLRYLAEGGGNLLSAIGLATANAMTGPVGDLAEDREATTYLNLKPGEKVVMVGLFAPLVERIRATGAVLTIIEKNPARLELLSPEAKQQSLQTCDVAIITATTLLNHTFENIISLLGAPRTVLLLGPSTPLRFSIFDNTPVTHLGGAIIADSSRVLQVISEGGGTPALRPYLRFVNLLRK